ncbi:MAG: pilus assembly protein PilM, partial [Candidatus Marinimicrobia bacterium]|nr:pilus assembly protein PilM [Candidatus Neomarinimicrobiota bacterium]
MAQEEYIGLAPRGGQLEWAALRRRPGRAEPNRDGSLAVVGPPPDWRATLSQLKPPLAGPCVLGLPSEQVLLRVVELPSTDLTELEGMVPLQLDKISPFPVEQLAVGFEWLAGTEQKSRVLVVAVRREILDGWQAALEQGALALERVDIQGLAWWRLLRARPAPDSDQQLYLIHDGQDTELIVVRQQVPVVFRSLG